MKSGNQESRKSGNQEAEKVEFGSSGNKKCITQEIRESGKQDSRELRKS